MPDFPKSFSQYGDGAGSTDSFHLTSTVIYTSPSELQTIFPTPVYGNLSLSNAAAKTAGGPLTVAGNLDITNGAHFTANGATGWTHNIGGNWTNNGIFSYSSPNTINFYGFYADKFQIFKNEYSIYNKST